MTDDERDDQGPEGRPPQGDADPEGPADEGDIAATGDAVELEPGPESEPEPEAELEPAADAIDRPSASAAIARPGAGPSSALRPSDIAVHIDDRISAIFALAAIAVFIGILLFGILGGAGGVLTPLATPTPSASPSPTASGDTSPRPSASPSP